MKKRRYDGLILDLDGTTIDSFTGFKKAIFLFRDLYFPNIILSDQDLIEAFPLSTSDLLTQLFRVDGNTWCDTYGEIYQPIIQKEDRLYPFVIEVLSRFIAHGGKVAVASNKEHQEAVHCILHLGLEPFISAIVCYDDVEHPKPYPDELLKAQRLLGISERSRCLYLGDTGLDVQAGLIAGMDVGIAHYGPCGFHSPIAPHFFFASFLDLENHLYDSFYELRTLVKNPAKDFVILNLTDLQLGDFDLSGETGVLRNVQSTLDTLIQRVHPDLITITGDIAYAKHDAAFKKMIDVIDAYHIPHAEIFGNHDEQEGLEALNQTADFLKSYPFSMFAKGNPTLGVGNYVLSIQQNGQPLTALIMMDTHDRETLIDEQGLSHEVWAKLNDQQLRWYAMVVEALKTKGYHDAALLIHIPIHAYHRLAKAYPSSDHACDSLQNDFFGVLCEKVSSYPIDDHVLDTIVEHGLVHHVFAGHDHRNTLSGMIDGVRLTFALRAGNASYGDPDLNGGTVIVISNGGVRQVRHEFVALP